MSFGLSAAAVGLIGAGVGAATGIYGARQAGKAANAQIDGARDANQLAAESKDKELALQREMFEKNVALQQPAIDAGNTARSRLLQLLGLSAGGADNGSLMRDFGTNDLQADPGYQFRMGQGQQALERSAAARGGLLSGAALKDTARFSQGLGAQEYQAAYDRFQNNRTTKANPLLSLAGAAQTASGALGSAGQNFANASGNALSQYAATAGQNITGAGNARASGYLATGNALTGLLNGGISAWNQSRPPGSSFTGSAGNYDFNPTALSSNRSALENLSFLDSMKRR